MCHVAIEILVSERVYVLFLVKSKDITVLRTVIRLSGIARL